MDDEAGHDYCMGVLGIHNVWVEKTNKKMATVKI